MARCDGCQVPGGVQPLFTRLMVIEGETRCFLFCHRCQRMRQADLLRKIRLWLPPYDQRQMGVGA